MLDSPLLPLAIFGAALRCGGDVFDMMNGNCGSKPAPPPAAPPREAPPAPPRDRYQGGVPSARPSAAPMQSLFPDDGKPLDIRPQQQKSTGGAKTKYVPPAPNPLGPLY